MALVQHNHERESETSSNREETWEVQSASSGMDVGRGNKHVARTLSKAQQRESASLVLKAAITAIGIIAVQSIAVALNTIVITGLLPSGTSASAIEIANADFWINVVKWATGLSILALITSAASYLPTRAARWGISIGNLFFYIGATTQYSLSASPIWVLSQGQLIAWGYAVFVAITLSITEIILTLQFVRWRTIRRRPF